MDNQVRKCYDPRPTTPLQPVPNSGELDPANIPALATLCSTVNSLNFSRQIDR